MLKKTYTKTGKVCRVTFSLPPELKAAKASLCGDFNSWNSRSHPMKPLKNGGFSLTVSLPTGFIYEFRYLLDGKRWENDQAPDALVSNEFGSENSVIQI